MIAAKRSDTSVSWIHAIFMVVNINALLDKLHGQAGPFAAFLLRIVLGAVQGLVEFFPMIATCDGRHRHHAASFPMQLGTISLPPDRGARLFQWTRMKLSSLVAGLRCTFAA